MMELRSLKPSYGKQVVAFLKGILEDGEFIALDNDEDRARLRITKFPCTSKAGDKPLDAKDTHKSKTFRERGNAVFNSQSESFDAAINYYSKSVLYALPGTVELSLAYGNRSAVLFAGKYYKECLEDIERALKMGYPDDLKPKLLIRRVKCTYALTGNVNFEEDEALMEARSLVENLPATNNIKKMVEEIVNDPEKITSIQRKVEREEYPNFLPKLEEENPCLPGASSAIALKYSKKYGRHIVATRNIKSGETLMIEKPYVAIVRPEYVCSVCTHCMKRTWNSIPCDHCVKAMFCSEECKQAAWADYHDVECQVLGMICCLRFNHETLSALRLTVKAMKEAGSLENLRKRLKELDSIKDSDVEIPINPISYETFYVMSDNCEKKIPHESLNCTLNAVELTYYLATKTEIFGEKLVSDLKDLGNEEWFLFAAALMSRNFRIAQIRVLEVTQKYDKEVKIPITAMLLPISSFFNHRCHEFARFVALADRNITFYTTFPIKAGHQIFANYGGDFKTMPKTERMEMLQKQYDFVCDCLACENDWSISSYIPSQDQQLCSNVRNKIARVRRRTRMPNPVEDKKNPANLQKSLNDVRKYMDLVHALVQQPCSIIEETSNVMITFYEIAALRYLPFNTEVLWC